MYIYMIRYMLECMYIYIIRAYRHVHIQIHSYVDISMTINFGCACVHILIKCAGVHSCVRAICVHNPADVCNPKHN